MDRRTQPQLPPPRSYARHAQDESGRQQIYVESSTEQDEDWSDSSSERPLPNRHHQMPRNEPGAQPSSQAYTNDPGNAGYMRRAGGETIPYQRGHYDNNTFTSTYQPDAPPAWHQAAFVPFSAKQPASSAYRTGLNSYIPGPYPTNDHFANPYNLHYSPSTPYHYTTSTQPPIHHPVPGNNYCGDGFYSGPQPTPQYPTLSGIRRPPPVFEPSYPDYEPERAERASDNNRTDRQSRKKKPTPVRRKEAAEQRELWKIVHKLQKRVGGVESELSQQRDAEIRPDSGMARLDHLLRSPSILGRHTPDDLRSWVERRGGESGRILEDFSRFIEESRSQEDRGLYGSPRRESLEAPSRNRLELERGALMELRDDRDLRNKVETMQAIMVGLLDRLELGEPEDNQSPRRPSSVEYAIREGRRWSRGLGSVASSDAPIDPVTPTSGHGPPPRHNRVQNLPPESSRSTAQEQQDDPVYRNQTTQTLRQTRLQRNSTRAVNAEEDLEPSEQLNREPSDLRVPSMRARRGQAIRAPEIRDNVGRRREQPAVYRERDDFETTQGRPVGTGRQGMNLNFQANVRDEDGQESDEPQEPYPSRPPAPYELRQGHPNLRESLPPAPAPDPPPPSRRRRSGDFN